MQGIKLTELVDSVIDCLTDENGNHAVGNGDIKDAVLELKEIKALFINGVIPQLNTVGIDKDIGKSIDKLEKSDKFKRPTKKRF
jgi:hypothetical protein